QAEDGIRDFHVTGVQTCALPIFILIMAAASFAVILDFSKFGMAIAAMIRMIATTISNSMSENPSCRCFISRLSPSTNHFHGYTRSEERRVGKEWRSEYGGVHLRE